MATREQHGELLRPGLERACVCATRHATGCGTAWQVGQGLEGPGEHGWRLAPLLTPAGRSKAIWEEGEPGSRRTKCGGWSAGPLAQIRPHQQQISAFLEETRRGMRPVEGLPAAGLVAVGGAASARGSRRRRRHRRGSCRSFRGPGGRPRLHSCRVRLQRCGGYCSGALRHDSAPVRAAARTLVPRPAAPVAMQISCRGSRTLATAAARPMRVLRWNLWLPGEVCRAVCRAGRGLLSGLPSQLPKPKRHPLLRLYDVPDLQPRPRHV
jgi:hypothetical protein